MTTPRLPDESLIAMAGILVTGQSLENTLRQILELACTAVQGGDEGGITLLEAEGPDTAVSTSDVAQRVDSSQYEAETGGPCLDAYRQQQILRIDSTASDRRWPEFSGTASAAGIASTLSIPLVVGGDGLGAMNLYCHHEHGFPVADDQLAALLGSCASVALANARGHWRAARLADQLEQALATRGVIEQATGILMARRHCSAEQARYMLAAAAQRNHVTLTEVSADQVRRAVSPEPV
jgi:GAF domain-containing protein